MEKEKTGDSVRKAYAPKGTRTQALFTFRMDDDLREWVRSTPNMGRYINQLIRADMEKGGH